MHLEIGRPNAAVLQVACALAKRRQAAVVGKAVGRQLELVYPDGYMDGDLLAQDLEDIERNIGVACEELRSALEAAGTAVEWRAVVLTPNNLALVEQQSAKRIQDRERKRLADHDQVSDIIQRNAL